MTIQELHSPSKITNEYALWFDQRINEFIEGHKSRLDTKETFQRRNGFFITISFDQNSRPIRLRDSAKSGEQVRWSELDRFQDLYNRICRQVIGRNFHRDSFRDCLPLAIGCLDYNGTRYWKSVGELENPHIHSVWVLTDEIRGSFVDLLSDEERFSPIKERLQIRTIDIQPFRMQDRSSTGQNRVLSYAAKFIGHNHREMIVEDDLRILPI